MAVVNNAWRDELLWASGLFEGEGSVYLTKTRTDYPDYRYPMVAIIMTDEDSVRRFHRAMGLGKVYAQSLRAPNRKPIWKWGGYGFETTQAVGAMLWFGLGMRRREQLKYVLKNASYGYHSTRRTPRP